jgi:hypothetical protein
MRSAVASSKAREHPFGTSLALLLLAIGGSLVVAAAPARAACALTDLACATATVTEVTEPVTEITDPVTEVTDPVTGPVGGVVDEVKNTVHPIVDEVPPLPDPPVNVPEPPTPGESNVTPGARTESADTSGDSGNGRSDPVSGSLVEPTIPVQALVRDAFVSGLDPGPGSDVRIGPSPPTERAGVSLQDLVTAGFAFPVALVLIVGAFLLVQDRLDRRDPRLALAPVGPDVLDFT